MRDPPDRTPAPSTCWRWPLLNGLSPDDGSKSDGSASSGISAEKMLLDWLLATGRRRCLFRTDTVPGEGLKIPPIREAPEGRGTCAGDNAGLFLNRTCEGSARIRTTTTGAERFLALTKNRPCVSLGAPTHLVGTSAKVRGLEIGTRTVKHRHWPA